METSKQWHRHDKQCSGWLNGAAKHFISPFNIHMLAFLHDLCAEYLQEMPLKIKTPSDYFFSFLVGLNACSIFLLTHIANKIDAVCTIFHIKSYTSTCAHYYQRNNAAKHKLMSYNHQDKSKRNVIFLNQSRSWATTSLNI